MCGRSFLLSNQLTFFYRSADFTHTWVTIYGWSEPWGFPEIWTSMMRFCWHFFPIRSRLTHNNLIKLLAMYLNYFSVELRLLRLADRLFSPLIFCPLADYRVIKIATIAQVRHSTLTYCLSYSGNDFFSGRAMSVCQTR